MMSPEAVAKLRRSIIKHEGYEKFPYTDSVGKITIGIGYNLTDRGLDDEWINNQYMKDIRFFNNQLDEYFSWYKDLCTDRQIVLIDMCFMGWKKFLEFEKMITAIARSDFKQAAFEMLNSEWAMQVKGRAAELAQAMLTGEYNI